MRTNPELVLVLRWGYCMVENLKFKIVLFFTKFKIVTYSMVHVDPKNVIFTFLTLMVAKIQKK